MDLLKRTLNRQVEQVFKTLLQAIEQCPKDCFQIGAEDWNHSIGDLSMHVGRSLENAFPRDSFYKKWHGHVHSMQDCLSYIASCRDDLLFPFIAGYDLLEMDDQPEYFISRLDRVMKLLRHVAQHTGAINRLLSDYGSSTGAFI